MNKTEKVGLLIGLGCLGTFVTTLLILAVGYLLLHGNMHMAIPQLEVSWEERVLEYHQPTVEWSFEFTPPEVVMK